MDEREKIKTILEEICPGIDSESDSLIDDESIDSFDLVALVSELISEFDVDINVDDILPENFNSVDDMLKLIKSKR